jgi:hypothetical protein
MNPKNCPDNHQGSVPVLDGYLIFLITTSSELFPPKFENHGYHIRTWYLII